MTNYIKLNGKLGGNSFLELEPKKLETWTEKERNREEKE